MKFRVINRISADDITSLNWRGDTLVDWAGGGRQFQMDGTILPQTVIYSYRFDAACCSPSGVYAVIYERLGTKGLVLKRGQVVREINRSFYHANAYEYPVCMAQLPTGREVVIHCPEEYNQLEIDDLETGERLTRCEERKPADVFHSRLAVSPGNTHFLSAGWIWQPVDALGAYRLEDVLRDPRLLDDLGQCPPVSTEISSAAFMNENCIVLSTSGETFLDEEDYNDRNLPRPDSIAVWDLTGSRLVSQAPLKEPAGTLMPVDERFVTGFHEHPKLIDVSTGDVVARLEEVESGRQTSSIIHHIGRVPPLALDPRGRRFAIGTPREILVVGVETGD